jgi:hypothetical protein
VTDNDLYESFKAHLSNEFGYKIVDENSFAKSSFGAYALVMGIPLFLVEIVLRYYLGKKLDKINAEAKIDHVLNKFIIEPLKYIFDSVCKFLDKPVDVKLVCNFPDNNKIITLIIPSKSYKALVKGFSIGGLKNMAETIDQMPNKSNPDGKIYFDVVLNETGNWQDFLGYCLDEMDKLSEK